MELQAPKQKPLTLSAGSATGSATGSLRSKVALAPGHSLMDWIRLGQNGQDLTGVGGHRQDVTTQDLAKRNRKDDCWIALKGKVYNVTAYMDYHPGGKGELLQGAGIDATDLFNEVHKWVNFESMLSKCYIGKYIGSSVGRKVLGSNSSISTITNMNGNFVVPSLPCPLPPVTSNPAPRHEWFQTAEQITVVLYTKSASMRHEDVLIDTREPRHIALTCRIGNMTFKIAFDLEEGLENIYKVCVSTGGKVEMIFNKLQKGMQWSGFGTQCPGQPIWKKTSDVDLVYRECEVVLRETVTHDTSLWKLQLPTGCRMCVPTGCHVILRSLIKDVEVARSYTVVPSSLEVQSQDPDISNGSALYLLIKTYPGGALTPCINKINVGDKLEVSNFEGNFTMSQLDKCCHLVMFAAGTGFTPMAGLLVKALHDCGQIEKISLICFNKTEYDILWKDQLQTLASSYPSVSVVHVLSEPPSTWDGPTGRIQQALFDLHAPDPQVQPNTFVCACGPVPFTQETLRLAKERGYREEMLHAFLA